MSSLPSKESDNRIGIAGDFSDQSSCVTEGKLPSGDEPMPESDMESPKKCAAKSQTDGDAKLQSHGSSSFQCLHTTGLTRGLIDDTRTQMMQNAADELKRNEQKRALLLHHRLLDRRMYGARVILPQVHRPQPLPANALNGLQQASAWGSVSDIPSRRRDNLMQLIDITKQRDTMELLLLQHRQRIQRQKEWVDALHRELAKRRRTRENEFAARGERQCDASQNGASGQYNLQSGIVWHGEESVKTAQEKLEHSNGLSITGVIGSGFYSYPHTLSILPRETNVRRAEPRTPSLSPESTRKRKIAESFGRFGTQACSSFDEREARVSDMNSEMKLVQRASAQEQSSKPKARLNRGKFMQLSQPADRELLSEYQSLIRQSIELFEMKPEEIMLGVQGRRNNSIEAGQVGIRCRHCKHSPPHWRGQGAVYFPKRLAAVYQAAQNMAVNHFLSSCNDIAPDLREQFVTARNKQLREARRRGGVSYWVDACQKLGVEERPGKQGLFFG